VEEALCGQALSARSIDRAAGWRDSDGLTTSTADLHASEAYRRAMVPVFTRRALET
jgi:CO/xanthine dehydrogenase FAD-binding subunit